MPKHHIAIPIADRQSLMSIDKRQLRKAVRQVLEGEGICRARIGIALVDDTEIHILNRRYLQHDEPTDVLSFPLSDAAASDENVLEGEIAISVETAVHAANQAGTTGEQEVVLYAIHGTLHLLGYDDHTEEAARKMREREKHYLSVVRREQ